jgi:hypothetical protein
MDLLNTPQDIPFLSDPIQHEIIYRILRSPEGLRLGAIATAGDQNHRTAPSDRVDQGELREAAKSGRSCTLGWHGCLDVACAFRGLTSMSPRRYQKQLRLHAARARMLVDGLNATTAAFEVGYGSATQFNREYSRFFGQPPKRDVRTLRAPGFKALELVSE